MSRRAAALGALVRLSDLRLDIATRGVAAAEAALAAARAAVDRALSRARDLGTRAEREKAALRDAFVGAPATRSALGLLLDDLRDQDGRVAGAEADVAQARAEVEAAAGRLREARATRLAAERHRERRARMRAPVVQAARRAREAREEAEIAEAAAERRVARA